jgi:rfaE bifunctional protein kinase chain/domain
MTHIPLETIEEILNGIRRLKVAVLGDLAIDVYWHADMRLSELSRETPHFPLPVVEERISLGAGGNVVANVCSLKPQRVTVIGITGRDWRGNLVRDHLDMLGVDSRYLLASEDRVTFAYCKPIRKGISHVTYEDPRLDFINRYMPNAQDEQHIIEAINEIGSDIDVLVVSDQFKYGCVTDAVREAVCELGRKGVRVVADSRDRVGLFQDIILKPNEREALLAINASDSDMRLDVCFEAAMKLAAKCSSEVVMTLGERGSIHANDKGYEYIEPWVTEDEIDIVGAGDTFLSGFSCALAAGASFSEAADFAGLCSLVTITKLGMTGTAAPEEIVEAYKCETDKEANGL